MARYWVPQGDHSWLPSTLVESDENRAILKADDNYYAEPIELPAKALADLMKVDEQQETGVDDICSLQSANEAALLHTVRVRYLRDVIYTRVARVIIALNPFRALNIYSSQYTDQYMMASDSLELPPHIYGLSKDAIQGLRESDRDQAVLISGESGAGKTESAKLVLSFVTEAVRTGPGSLVEQVCLTSPILEAFGNAMTVRNNNSSRFGKWLDMRFSRKLELLGCSLTSYLLETTRVCSQSAGERGFHVFFQLLQARASPAFSELGLHDPGHYRYLQGAQLVAPGVDDSACFNELCDALAAVGFEDTMCNDIFKVVAGVLTMGNVDFKAGDKAEVEDESTLQHVAELLRVDTETLRQCMTVKKITVGADTVSSPLNADQALAARDALARLLYGQLFLWLINRINSTLSVPTAEKPTASNEAERLLGVLDIAGFESFAHNSLEQLLINLSNEHLQQSFNTVIFKNELKDCEAEGIKPVASLGFIDNSDCLALIDGKGGILELLDSTMVMPKSTNKSYVDKVTKEQAGHKRLIVSKIATLGFGIQHFAGGVTYGCEGWLEKNANRAPNDAVQLLASSLNGALSEIGKGMLAQAAEAAKPARGAAKKVKSVSAEFRASLKSLMGKIQQADPHYIRCVKPNMEKVPGRFLGKMVMEQLLLSGVLATVRIRQQGYAIRMPHRAFFLDYYCIILKAGKALRVTKETSDADLKAKVECMIELMLECLPAFKEAGQQYCVVGSTKVFMHIAASQVLDDARKRALLSLTLRAQALFRGRIERKRMKPLRLIADKIRAMLKRVQLDSSAREVPTASQTQGLRPRSRSSMMSHWSGDGAIMQLKSLEAAREALTEITALMEEADSLDFLNVDVMAARRVQMRLERELDMCSQLERLRESMDAVEMEKAIARANSLRIPPETGILALEARLERLRSEQALVQSLRAAIAACQGGGILDSNPLAELEAVVKAVREAGLEGSSEKWLPDLGGGALAAQALGRLQEHKSAVQAEARLQEHKSAVQAEAEAAAKPVFSPKPRDSVSPVQPASSEAKHQILKDLQVAAAEYDVESMEALLRKADELGLGSKEPEDDASDAEDKEEGNEGSLAEARRVFENLQSLEFVVGALESACSEVVKHDVPMAALHRLEHLSRQLRQLPGYEEEVYAAGQSLRKGLLRRSNTSKLKSVFDTGSSAELELAKRAFGSISDFPALKEAWRGGQKLVAGSAASKTGGKLAYSKVCLDEALTYAPQCTRSEAFEATAVQNFRNVLVCMGDRPAQECQRQASREAIIQLARGDQEGLRNEVYLQVLKQLVACPRERSARLGWGLLQKLCLQAPPSSEVAQFIRQTVNKFVDGRPEDTEVSATARFCLAILDGNEDEAPEDFDLSEERASNPGEFSPNDWTPGVSRLKADNARLRSLNKQQAEEIQQLGAEVERLTAELVQLGGHPVPGPRRAPHVPQISLKQQPGELDAGELNGQAMRNKTLSMNEKTADDLMKLLNKQRATTTPKMASAPKGGPSAVRFMDLPDSDSDVEIEIDLSGLAEVEQ